MPVPSTTDCFVLLVNGAPASGKTTVGRRLAHDLKLPFLSKDLIKETLFDTLGWSERAWSRTLGGASMQVLYRIAAALLEAEQSVALESNFYPEWDLEPILDLQARFGCEFAQVLCAAPGPLLIERFRAREATGERHPGHAGQSSSEEVEQVLARGPWPALPIGGLLLNVETSDFDAIDYEGLLKRLSSRPAV